MFKTNDTDTACAVCEYIRVHEWVGPGRHHCVKCHRTWSGSTQVHCVTCHAHFSSPTADDRHRTREGCQHPSLATTRKGEPALEGRETKFGLTWYRLQARSEARSLDALGAQPVSVSPPAPDTWGLSLPVLGGLERGREAARSAEAA